MSTVNLSTFDNAFDALIGHEGGYQRDPKDRGNWTTGVIGKGELKGTKFGIAAHVYPHLDIKNLTVPQAKRIYLTDYWNRLNLDRLPETVRFDLFDTAVNSGVRTAAQILQRAVGEVEDGLIGVRTISAAAMLDPQILDKRFNGHRLLFLTDLRTPWPAFGRGWVRRCATNLIKD